MREGILGALLQRGCTEAAERGKLPGRQLWGWQTLHAQLLGGEGAHSEVFPGHQATRGSPGGCNSSPASILLSGPVPRACYCRCTAAFPPACPCPLHCTLCSHLGLPHPARAPAALPCFSPPASFPLHASSLPSWFLSPHPGFVFITPSPWCQTASTDTPQGPWARAGVALATKDHHQHSDVLPQGSRNYP